MPSSLPIECYGQLWSYAARRGLVQLSSTPCFFLQFSPGVAYALPVRLSEWLASSPCPCDS